MLVEQITRERLEAEFGSDPLFDAVQRMNLVDELFDDETLTVLVERHEYTTTEFEKWFCIHEADPRYLSTPGIMRAFVKELSTYLQTRTIGRTIIIDYQGVIKLKMALLLRKSGMKPALIYETAGTKAYSPAVIQRGQGGGIHSQTPATPKSQKEVLYEQLMESLFTQLTAAGAVTQVDGKIHVDLRALIEKQIEVMAPALLPPEAELTQQKLEQLDEKISRLKDLEEKNRGIVEDVRRNYEEKIENVSESISELRGKFESDTLDIKNDQETRNECRNKAMSLYHRIKTATSISLMEELCSVGFSELEGEYPHLLYIIHDFRDKSDNLIVRVKLEERQMREKQVKDECLRLYNVMIGEKSTKAEIEEARSAMMRLQESNSDISFEIRSFIAAAQTQKEMSKEKSGGFFSWFKKSPRH